MRAQNDKERMSSYREMVPEILKTEGYRGLYRGFWATFWRDVPGLGFYFYIYEYLKLSARLKFNTSENDFLTKLLCGGLGGTLTWILSFPLDVVKT